MVNKAIFLSCILFLSLLLITSGINASDITDTSSSLSEEKSSESMGVHDDALGRHKVVPEPAKRIVGKPVRGHPYVRPGAPVTVGGKPGKGKSYIGRAAHGKPGTGRGKHFDPRRCPRHYLCRPPQHP